MIIPRIFIGDDDIDLAKDLEDKVAEIGYKLAGMAHNHEDIIAGVLATKPNIIILDINFRLAGESETEGIEIAKMLKRTISTPIIFVTAYDELWEKIAAAFCDGQLPRSCSSYFLKSQIDRILQGYEEIIPIYLKDKSKIPIKENVYDILYIKGSGDWVDIVFSNGEKYATTHKLAIFMQKHDLEKNPFIWRVHKSYYINARKIKGIKGDEIYLHDLAESIKIGGEYKAETLKKYQVLSFKG